MPKQRTTLILAVLFVAVIAVSYFAYLPSSAPLAAQVSLASDYIKPNPANTIPASAANVALTTPSAATSAPQAAEKVGYPWHKYPGTLNDQVLHAFASKDGQMAFDVAALLFECRHITRQLTPATQQTLPPELVLSLQREYANCQTLAGDSQHIRTRLLKLAIEKDIAGAALAGMRSGLIDPPILQNVVRDAESGDIESLVTITDDKPLTFGINSDTQATLRYALKLASQDPEVGKNILPYLSLAEATAYALGNSKTKEFDHSGLSDAAKAEAGLIAARILARTKLLAK